MEYRKESFRHGLELAQEPQYNETFQELLHVIESITDQELIERHERLLMMGKSKPKSISRALNQILKEKLIAKGWSAESPIFSDPEYSEGADNKRWRLDFAKGDFSVEVAFNHGEAIAWNLLKPVLASELNHVEKAIQTRVGIVITATAEFKEKGGFDSAVGEFEKLLRYLNPLRTVLTVPMVILGLEAPQTFRLRVVKENGKKIGQVVRY